MGLLLLFGGAVAGPAVVPLQTTAAQSAATLAVTAPTRVVPGTAAAASAATLALTAPTRVPLGAAAAVSAGTLALTAAARVPPGPAAATSSASLALSARTSVPLAASAAVSSASLALAPFTFAALQDPFDTLDTGIWQVSGGAALDAGRIKIPILSSYAGKLQTSPAPRTLIGSSVYAEMALPPVGSGSRQVFMLVTPSDGNDVGIYRNGSNIEARVRVAFSDIATQNLATSDTWWRIRESGGTVYFDTSADGSSWTNRWTQATPAIDLANAFLVVLGGYYGTESASDAYVDNVNTTPSAAVEVPLGTTTGQSAATLALTAPTRVALGTATGASTATLALTAPPRVVLGTAAAQSAATAALTVQTYIPLGTSTGQSSATLVVQVPTGVPVPLATAAATSTGTLALRAPAGVLLGTSTAQGSATLTFTAPTRVTLQASAAQSTATLAVFALGAGPAVESHPPLNGDVTEYIRGGVIVETARGGTFDESVTGGVPFGR